MDTLAPVQFRASLRHLGTAHAVRCYGASGDLVLERHALTAEAAYRKAAAELAQYFPAATLQVAPA